MSQRALQEIAKIKPLSRFVEHFELQAPPELLENDTMQGLQRNRPSNLTVQTVSLEPVSSPSPTTKASKFQRSQSNPTITTNQAVVDPPTISTNTKEAKSPIVNRASNNNSPDSTYASPTSPSSSRSSKLIATRTSLNRADIFMKRCDAWSKFLSVVISWVNEMARLSTQSERSFTSLLKENLFVGKTSPTIDSANRMHAAMQGLTTDLASQEQQFGRRLKDRIPLLEKFKKECALHIKSLKSRSDLALDEFLRRAEVTASLMTQLSKACKEARNAIEKGSQLTADPWLANLYVLRQLKREVDEENRLRRLMVPVQQTMFEFETRLLQCVAETLKICLERPGLVPDDKLVTLQEALNGAVADNWDTFMMKNKKDAVNEKYPEKHYLKINYPFKNDPLVMTLYKGELERKSGVLSKYNRKYFVLTESGYLHQFKLNEKVSPETSIYVPKSTVVPCMDISHLNLTALQSERTEEKTTKSYSFEIQRSGSVLQRDKSYAFRTSTIEELVIWCKLLGDVATRPLDAVLKEQRSRPQSRHSSVSEIARQFPLPQDQESTPPPSPVRAIVTKNELQVEVGPSMSPTSTHTEYFEIPSPVESAEQAFTKHKMYTPQLNI